MAGCTVVSGAGTHQITVEWGEPGTGFVLVTEFDGDCAASTGPYEVVIEECTAIRETYGNVLFVYPNPADDKLFFTIPGIQAGTVQVLDATGRILLHSGFDAGGNSAVEVDLSSLRPGIYFLRVTGPDGSKAMSKFNKTD